ncbi:MAG: peptidylprolyl isomerase [Kofleriaceae bacterium]|nr:peptidylprolyl isomerase [Kofleriaceae bacterium]
MRISALICCVSLLAACGSRREPDFQTSTVEGEQGGYVQPSAPAPEPPPAAPPTPPPAAPPQASPPAETPPAAPLVELDPRLLDPSLSSEQAPATYTVELATTKGPILIDVTRAWAPLGADRFYNLVKIGYFQDVAFFRVVAGFMAQTGIHIDPRVNERWRRASFADDPVTQHNTRGMVTFATSGANSRTTQFFINLVDNSNLDAMGFSPFGRVRDMRTVDALYSGYGEGAPQGRGPEQMRMQLEGTAYLRTAFPDMDWIRSARIMP